MYRRRDVKWPSKCTGLSGEGIQLTRSLTNPFSLPGKIANVQKLNPWYYRSGEMKAE
jgi:hypothetical protein